MKNIVIVGAGKGIGLKLSELLNADNHLITISRNPTTELESLHTKFYRFDVTKDDINILNDLPDEIHGVERI